MKKFKIGNIVRYDNLQGVPMKSWDGDCFKNSMSKQELWTILHIGDKSDATPWILCKNLSNGEEKWWLGTDVWEIVA